MRLSCLRRLFFVFAGVLVAATGGVVLGQAGNAAMAQDGKGVGGVGAGTVLVLDIDGTIGVGAQQYLENGLAEARRIGAVAIIVRLDTPGGLVASTRQIIRTILASSVPVITYVAPSGARAASAGTYIAYASHVAAMAPGTHLGAATPIQIGSPGLPGTPSPKRDGEKDGEKPAAGMEQKIINDAVAYMRSLAQLRGRNAEWAEAAVRQAATLTAAEAAKMDVVDVVAGDLAALLREVDGRETTTSQGTVRLATRNAVIQQFDPDWKTQVITLITDPNFAFILLMIGVYGIIFEFWSPGLAGPGIVGAISLLLGLTALTMLPVNFAGLGLLALGVALMVGEALAPGLGVLGLGGAVAFVLGAVFLFDPAGADIDFAVTWPVIVSVTLTSLIILVGLMGVVMRSRHSKVVTGAEELIGLEGRVVSWSGGAGRVHLHGETWSATSASALDAGDGVRVVAREGLTLEVVPDLKRSL